MTNQMASEAPISAEPAPEAVAEATAPLTEPVVEPAAKPEEKPSLRDSLAKAAAEVEKKAAETDKPKPVEAKAPVKDDAKPADPKPIDAAKEGEKEADPKQVQADADKAKPTADAEGDKAPPKRFLNEAKSEWEAVPDKVKAETHRAFRELEAGIEKHRPASQRYSEVFKEFDELAKTSNVDAKATLRGYVEIDKMLHSNDSAQKVQGIESVLKAAGVTPQQYAEFVLGSGAQQAESQPQQSAQPSREVLELREQVAQLTKMVGGVTQHVQTQVQERHNSVLQEWAADKPHLPDVIDRVTELVRDDGLLPDDAYVKALGEAQDRARALLGESSFRSSSPKAADLNPAELEDQTLKGSKSIKGAPSAGSAPAARKPGSSIRDSLRKAIQAAG